MASREPQPSPEGTCGIPNLELANAASAISRRDFVITMGAVGGGIILGAPLAGDAATLERESATADRAIGVELVINGQRQRFSLDPRVTLLDLLREHLSFTGTKKGCDHGQCGACTVLANGRRINSCLSLAVVHDGEEITTIEGLARDGELHPLQAAFLDHDGYQCGYCTPGQLCSAVALLQEAARGDASAVTPAISEVKPVELTAEEIRERMSGNLCRCGAYPGILEAVQAIHQTSNRGTTAARSRR